MSVVLLFIKNWVASIISGIRTIQRKQYCGEIVTLLAPKLQMKKADESLLTEIQDFTLTYIL